MSSIRRSRLTMILMAGVTALASGCGTDGGSAAEPTVDRALLASYSASWDGYVEAFAFRSGSDHVRINLDAQGNGWLQVGDGAALLPPRDPEVGYPAEASGTALELNLFDGVRYPVASARIESERLRFSFDSFAGAYGAWCALQTPVVRFNEEPAPIYGCTAEASVGNADPDGICRVSDAPGGPRHPIDCMKLLLCNGGCRCDAQACTSQPSPPFLVDAALSDDGTRLEGTLLIPDWSAAATPRTIRLQKMTAAP